MGNGAMSGHKIECGVLTVRQEIRSKARISTDAMVAHYTPSSFPMIPLINKNTSKILKDSWQTIVNKNSIENGNSTSGITLFYNEFYERLAILDTSGQFETVLTNNVQGMSMLHARGAILIRMVKYFMSIEDDSREIRNRLHLLGKSHAKMEIRPWQYSTFVQTLLLTISSRLGTGATTDVMSAWVNMFAFVMKGMLPSAIGPMINTREIAVNTVPKAEINKPEVDCVCARKTCRFDCAATTPLESFRSISSQ